MSNPRQNGLPSPDSTSKRRRSRVFCSFLARFSWACVRITCKYVQLLVYLFPVCLIEFSILMSGYEYRVIGNDVKRAWHVKLPGYRVYTDITVEPPVVRRCFEMQARFRVGPWIDPEGIE